MKGYYHSIETFGTVDGPGIRYVLFLSGCSLGCAFCHNPDTWQQGTKAITVDEVLSDVKRYKHFYGGEGAITVSGGEPLRQAEFVAALFAACRRQGIHTLLDTSGDGAPNELAKVLPYTDYLQLSLKGASEERYRELTHKGRTEILENLEQATATGIPIVIRYVVIPSITNQQDDITALAALVNSLAAPVSVELLGYHAMGKEKWKKLGWTYKLDHILPATQEDLLSVAEKLHSYGVKVLK